MTSQFIRAEATPPALNANARPWILFGLALVFGMFGLLGGWAATASISSAVIAQGVITVDGKRKLIQHLEGGIVRKLLVQDGHDVTAGQVLVELDPTRAKASVAIIEGALRKEMASEARLFAERDGMDAIAYPTELLNHAHSPEVRSLMESQGAFFLARRASLRGEIEILRQRIAQLGEESNGLEAQREAKAQQTKLITEELEGVKHLLALGQMTKPRVLALERAAAALRGEEGELIATIARTKKGVGETDLAMMQREKDFQKSVSDELQQVQAQLRDLRERAIAARDVFDRINISAPVEGTIVNLAVHTVGAVIKPGDAIMEIVPGKKNFVIEVAIRPQDIDNVTSGQVAVVRLLSFKQRTVPILNGHVIYVSADSLENKTTREPYYVANIELPEEEIARLGELKLQPGMQTEVMIKTGDRTALQYILQPITDSMNRAMREE